MTWFKVDDKFHSHPKVLRLIAEHPRQCGNALALWVRAGSYAAAHCTDGYIPLHVACTFVVNPRSIRCISAALVDVGLWTEEQGGWRFGDWLTYNPSAEEVKGKREASAARVAAHRAKCNALQKSYTSTSVTPLPTRPDPTRELQDIYTSESAEKPKPGSNKVLTLARACKAAYKNEHETRFPAKGPWDYASKFDSEFQEMARNCIDESDAQATVKAFFDSSDPFVIKAKYSPKLLATTWHAYKPGTFKTQTIPKGPWVFDFHNEPPTSHPMYATWERMYNDEIKKKYGG